MPLIFIMVKRKRYNPRIQCIHLLQPPKESIEGIQGVKKQHADENTIWTLPITLVQKGLQRLVILFSEVLKDDERKLNKGTA
jgi:hypothetical protein